MKSSSPNPGAEKLQVELSLFYNWLLIIVGAH